MGFESIEDIIKFAIKNEKEAAAFYAECAEKEPFEAVKDDLLAFSAEEKKHQAMLENLGQNQELIADYNLKWVPDMKRSDYIDEIEYEPGMHYVDILRLSMKREEQALKMYNSLQGKTDNPENIKVFQILSQEEAKHKQFFETLYDDYMAEQGD
ncbi:MAG: ferritin family protein [Deltaproteobacteria bacterium]|nr:ferritin family protein [Deltaproteobacteria bacterium]MBW2192774.1 ferritin family protein [Deltaproteobacteria bacterium]